MKGKTKEMKEREKTQMACPVCTLFNLGSQIFGMESEFFRHMTNARIEFLQAIKSIIDRRIESLEKAKEKTKKKKFSKISVEE